MRRFGAYTVIDTLVCALMAQAGDEVPHAQICRELAAPLWLVKPVPVIVRVSLMKMCTVAPAGMIRSPWLVFEKLLKK